MSKSSSTGLTVARVLAVGFALTMVGCLVYQAQEKANPKEPSVPSSAPSSVDYLFPSTASGESAGDSETTVADGAEYSLSSSKSAVIADDLPVLDEEALLLFTSKSAVIELVDDEAEAEKAKEKEKAKRDATMIFGSKSAVIDLVDDSAEEPADDTTLSSSKFIAIPDDFFDKDDEDEPDEDDTDEDDADTDTDDQPR